MFLAVRNAFVCWLYNLAIKIIAKVNVKRVWKELSGNSFSIQAKGKLQTLDEFLPL